MKIVRRRDVSIPIIGQQLDNISSFRIGDIIEYKSKRKNRPTG